MNKSPEILAREKKYKFTTKWFNANIANWHRFLDHLKTKKMTVLEIGVFEGAATTWILDELFGNPESKIIAVDTFEGSLNWQEDTKSKEYNQLKNAPVSLEQRFYENINKTKKNQIEVIKSDSYNALIKLNYTKKMFFDFIYVDASHTARDVISDAVLAWELLSENGIMIFDDYQWDKYLEDYNNPRLAVDAFIACFKPEIEIIDSGYQMILKKIQNKSTLTPNPSFAPPNV